MWQETDGENFDTGLDTSREAARSNALSDFQIFFLPVSVAPDQIYTARHDLFAGQYSFHLLDIIRPEIQSGTAGADELGRQLFECRGDMAFLLTNIRRYTRTL